jgi:hypothetical protein
LTQNYARVSQISLASQAFNCDLGVLALGVELLAGRGGRCYGAGMLKEMRLMGISLRIVFAYA